MPVIEDKIVLERLEALRIHLDVQEMIRVVGVGECDTFFQYTWKNVDWRFRVEKALNKPTARLMFARNICGQDLSVNNYSTYGRTRTPIITVGDLYQSSLSKEPLWWPYGNKPSDGVRKERRVIVTGEALAPTNTLRTRRRRMKL